MGRILFVGALAIATVDCAHFSRNSIGGGCARPKDSLARLIASRYEMTPHGPFVSDATVCRKASIALDQRDSRGKLYDVIVIPLPTGEYDVIAPALGLVSAGEFDCVVRLDANLRYKAHMCG